MSSNTAEGLLEALKAIVEEVDGDGAHFSSDSYLPVRFIFKARQAIEAHERCQEQTVERQQLEAIGQVGKRLDCLLDETPELMP